MCAAPRPFRPSGTAGYSPPCAGIGGVPRSWPRPRSRAGARGLCRCHRDARYGSLITQSSPLFGVIANLQVGDKVSFDGEFLRDPAGKTGTWKSSMTERGSMDEPEFNIRFTKVEPFGEDLTRRAPGVSQAAGEVTSPVVVRTAARIAAASSEKANDEATLAAPPESDMPYAKIRAELIAEGYEPANAPTGDLRHTVDGDAAPCGNAGCQIPWSKGDHSVCVSVQVNDNLDEARWLSQRSMGACAY